MKTEKPRRTRRLHVRLTDQEYEILSDRLASTTCRQISDYARKLLLQKPVTVYHRNQSLDQLMPLLVTIKNDLNALANNYNQVVRKLHLLQHQADLKAWLPMHEKNQQLLQRKVSDIKVLIAQISDQWLQS
ncbi:MAG: plasmid mobilization protein [Pseudobacter sp.]|uniref:plasmid mobilization protein n=1 Tax=Pseudobacter sp. TaxID=2045420 RepID=UPI003F7FFD6B